MALPGEGAAHVAHACPAEGILIARRVIEAQQRGKGGLGLADIQSRALREALPRPLLRSRLHAGEGFFRACGKIEILIGGKPFRPGGEGGSCAGNPQSIVSASQPWASPFESASVCGDHGRLTSPWATGFDSVCGARSLPLPGRAMTGRPENRANRPSHPSYSRISSLSAAF